MSKEKTTEKDEKKAIDLERGGPNNTIDLTKIKKEKSETAQKSESNRELMTAARLLNTVTTKFEIGSQILSGKELEVSKAIYIDSEPDKIFLAITNLITGAPLLFSFKQKSFLNAIQNTEQKSIDQTTGRLVDSIEKEAKENKSESETKTEEKIQ